jgi:hypothetical protein
MMNRYVRPAAVAILALGLTQGAVPARADVLLNLLNPVPQVDTPYALTFTAISSATTISIAGYQLPYEETSSNNGVYLNGAGPNLLGQNWKFTPAPADSYGIQYNDGTSVNAVLFGAYEVGDYDIFSQTIATRIGSSYTVDLLFSQYAWAGIVYAPSGFLVMTAIPEPTSVALLGAGLLGLCLGRILTPRRVRVPGPIAAA